MRYAAILTTSRFEDLLSGADPEFTAEGGADPRGWRGEIKYDFPEKIHKIEKTFFGRGEGGGEGGRKTA